MKLSIVSAAVFATLLPLTACEAADSRTHGQRGALAWSAFECSVLALHMKNEADHERLFEIGMESGRKFFVAAEANEISQEEVNSSVPMVVLMIAQGPSIDFKLGRLFQTALEDVNRRMREPAGDDYPSDELQKLRAENLYREKNCALLNS